MSEVQTNKISPATGTGLTLGDSGDTITIPSGATITNSGTATGFGEANTPAFSVQLGFNQSQSVSEDTITKVQLDDEYFDTDNAFDTSTYRFTVPSGKAGKYFFTWSIYLYQATLSNMRIVESLLYLNGNRYIGSVHNGRDVYFRYATKGNSAFLNLNEGDYIELYGNIDTVNGGGSPEFFGGDRATFLTGYRVTT